MKQEFTWILNIELEVDESVKPEHCENEVYYAFECAQDKFFDVLNDNENIASWQVLNEELK